MSDEEKRRLNRINLALDQIESNAKRATPGPWSISHSHVIKHDKRGDKDMSYDIAARPWERNQTVMGVYPYATPSAADDMRHIVTCDPKRMLQLVEDVRSILAAQKT